MPLVLYDVDAEGNKEEVKEGDLYNLIQQPSPGVSQKEFIEQSFTFLLGSGDLFFRKEGPIGFPTDKITIYPSGLTDVLMSNSYLTGPKGYLFRDKVDNLKLGLEDILHIKYLDPTKNGIEGGRGLSPLEAAYYSLKSSSTIQEASSVSVKNQGVRGVLTNRSDMGMSEEAKKDMQKIANAKLSGTQEFNKVLATTANLDFLQLGMSTADLKILELGVLSLRQLCSAYSVSSMLFNDIKASNFGNNLREVEKSLIINAVLPTLENKILWSLNQDIVKQYSEREGRNYSIEVNKSSIEVLQKDQSEEAKKNGVISKAILEVLTSAISQESKVNLLIKTHGLLEEEAQLIVGTDTNLQNNE